jgi:hypothetical protein
VRSIRAVAVVFVPNLPSRQSDSGDAEFGLREEVGCYGMLACVVALMGVIGVAGIYTLATGEALRLPLLEIAAGWFAALAVSEVLAFGWIVIRVALLCGLLSGALVFLIEGAKAAL